MTCIAVIRTGKNKFQMSGDRCVSDEHMEKHVLPHPKIIKAGNALIGGCGDVTALSLVLQMPEVLQFDYVPNLHNYIWDKFVPKVKKLFKKNEVQEDHEQDEDHKTDNCVLGLLIVAQNRIYSVDIKTKGIELYEVASPAVVGSGTPYWKAAYMSYSDIYTKTTHEDATRFAHYITSSITTSCDNNIDIIKGGGLI